MDTKRMIIGMLLIAALGLGYQYFLQIYVYPKHPEWATTNQQPTTAPATEPSFVSTSPADLIGGQSGKSNPNWQIVPSTQPASARIGSNEFQDARYHMAISFVPDGAAIDSVVLNQYRQEVDQPELYTYQTPISYDDPNTHVVSSTHALETLAVIIDGDTTSPVFTGNTPWALTSRTDHSITYSIELTSTNAKTKDDIRVDKQYVIAPVTTDPAAPRGYEVAVNFTVENLSDKPPSVALQFAGPTFPKAETARQDTEIVAGSDDDGSIKLEDAPVGGVASARGFAPGQLIWLGASSNYFNAIVRLPKMGQLASAVAEAINPTSPREERMVRVTMTTKDLTDKPLPPGGSASLGLNVFLGPKLRSLLDSQYYSSYPLSYDKTLVMVSGICAFCTFPALISFLVMLLNGFHHVLFGDWGLAIIALVCCVRLCLHPITKKSQVSMLKMQKLAPEMERLKKKFGDDKEGFTKAQMELYKNVGFTPILGCSPMFLQMPIFIALWRALQTTFELRQAPFLEFFKVHFTWIHDLSQPDFLVKFSSPVPLYVFGWHLAGLNVLPLAMAVVTFINQKYFTPKPAALTPEQEQQQKMKV